MSRKITLLYFFSRNLISFGQKEPINVQSFSQEFYQISILISPFCRKSIELRLKKYRGLGTLNNSWQWRVMQNLKKNLPVVYKMTWGTWQIFTRNVITKKYAAKFLSEIDLSFQNRHEEFDRCLHEHSEVFKMCTLIGSFWPKYIIFELNKYRGVIFHDTEDWCKFWRKTDLWFVKWQEGFGKFLPEH